jgi:tRNA (guanine37-N1)-methyltransferase
MRIDTLSVFPELFDGSSSAVDSSIIGRARKAGILSLNSFNLRDWTHDRHRTVDDQPYGGGHGLLMKVEPVFEALDQLLGDQSGDAEVIFFAPFGRRFDQAMAMQLAKQSHLIMVCGRYEGFDERVYTRADRIVSLGDFVLTGGELAAMCVIDAVCRLLPGALGDLLSSVDESFTDGLLEYPQYTRPATYRGLSVPEVLMNGNHSLISKWRREQSIIKTARWRPDLLNSADLDAHERQWIMQITCKDQYGQA